MPAPAVAPLRWSLVVPVKALSHAKTRLAALAGPDRPALALAMAADTVSAALRCPEVARVLVVTGDRQAAAELRGLGAVIVAVQPGRGLNPALRKGAARAGARWPRSGPGPRSGRGSALARPPGTRRPARSRSPSPAWPACAIRPRPGGRR